MSKRSRKQRLTWLLFIVRGFNRSFRSCYYKSQVQEDFKISTTIFLCQSLRDLVYALELQLVKELKESHEPR